MIIKFLKAVSYLVEKVSDAIGFLLTNFFKGIFLVGISPFSLFLTLSNMPGVMRLRKEMKKALNDGDINALSNYVKDRTPDTEFFKACEEKLHSLGYECIERKYESYYHVFTHYCTSQDSSGNCWENCVNGDKCNKHGEWRGGGTWYEVIQRDKGHVADPS